jgi:hypothetical protein
MKKTPKGFVVAGFFGNAWWLLRCVWPPVGGLSSLHLLSVFLSSLRALRFRGVNPGA